MSCRIATGIVSLADSRRKLRTQMNGDAGEDVLQDTQSLRRELDVDERRLE